MAITYHAGRRIQGTSTDVAVVNRGTITTDGSYTVIKFTENGTFTPTSSFNVEYLVVAGGGGSGAGYTTFSGRGGGGGGAGGYLTGTGHGVTPQDYNITVGAGGTANNNGSNSVFSSFTSIGGGRGGQIAGNLSAVGGSGGGGSGGDSGSAGTAGQGNAGGNGSGNGSGGAGGGGSGSAGANGVVSAGGSGGAGTANSITGTSITYAAGGDGGNSDSSGAGTAGAANTGNGASGGSGDNGAAGAAGGSGIVILRFLTNGNGYNSGSGFPENVQVGSRFEETDTRKMYNYKESDTIESTATYQYTSMTGSQTITNGSYEISAQKIVNSSSELVGERIGRIDVPMALASGTGTVTAGVFDSSGNTLHTFGTRDITTISTSTNPYNWYSFTGTSGYTLSVGEYVGVKIGSSGSLHIPHRDSGSQYDGSNSHWDRWNGSWSGSFTNLDQNIKLYTSTAGGTFAWQEIGT
jgi:hypothetical protein